MKFISKVCSMLSDVFCEEDPVELIGRITLCTFLLCICAIMIIGTLMITAEFFSWIVTGVN